MPCRTRRNHISLVTQKARAPLPLPSQHDQITGEMKVQEGSAQHGTCEQFGAHLGDLAKPKCPLDARLPTLKSLHTKANAETTAERRSKARPRRLRQALENRSQRTLTSSLSEATLPTIGDHVCKAHVSNDPGASPLVQEHSKTWSRSMYTVSTIKNNCLRWTYGQLRARQGIMRRHFFSQQDTQKR